MKLHIPPKTDVVAKLILLTLSALFITVNSFAQDYTIPASGSSEIDACSGTVRDPGGTGNYGANQDGTLIIDPPGNASVSLTFSQFNFENNWDYLRIYDGRGTATEIGSYTGTGNPGTITSTQGAITLVMDSDGSIHRAGFTAAISTADVPVAAGVMTAGGLTSFCEGGSVTLNYTLGTGSVRQWQVSSDGTNYTDLAGESGSSYVVPTTQAGGYYYFRVFEGNSSEENCATDYSNVVEVEILPTSNGGGISIENACVGGTATLSFELGDVGNLQWQSSPNGVSGWSNMVGATSSTHSFTQTSSLYYRLSYDFSPCGGSGYTSVIQGYPIDCRTVPYSGSDETNECMGTITDDGGDGNYASDNDGYLIIDPAGSGTVTLKFSEFRLEENWDDLFIYDGRGTGGTLLASFTGYDVPKPVTSTSGAITILFESDFTGEDTGFKFEYCVNNAPLANDPSIAASGAVDYCEGGTVDLTFTPAAENIWNWEYGTDGVFFTEIPGATGLTYTVPTSLAPGRHTYRVVGTSVDRCNTYISEVEDVSVMPTSGPGAIGISDDCVGQNGTVFYFGVDAGSFQWESSSDGLTWTPIPGATNATYSFVEGTPVMYRLYVDYSPCGPADYTNVVHSYPTECPPVGLNEYAMTATTITDCEGVVRDPGGEALFTIGGSDVTTVIDPVGPGLVSVEFNQFSTEEDYDFLTLYDGIGTANLLGSYSGNTAPVDFVTDEEALTLHFLSDALISLFPGFELYYKTVFAEGYEAGMVTPAGDSLVCEGVEMDFSYAPGDGTTYQWQISTDRLTFVDIAGQNGTTYTLPNTQAPGTYYIWVKETMAGTCYTSYSNIVEVTVMEATIAGISIDEACIGEVATVNYLGDPSATFQWQSSPNGTDWSNIPGETGSTLSYTVDKDDVHFRLFVEYGTCGGAYTTALEFNPYYCGDANFTITDCTGRIADSGGADEDYANDEDYTITIQPADATTIDVTFTLFEHFNGLDEIEFFDGPTTASPSLGTWSGTNNPGTVSSTGNALTMRIQTSGANIDEGFLATFDANCNAPEKHGTYFLKSNTADPNDISSWFKKDDESEAQEATQFVNYQDTFVVAIGSWVGGVLTSFAPLTARLTGDFVVENMIIPEGGTILRNDGFDFNVTGSWQVGEGSAYYHESIDQDPTAGVEITDPVPVDMLLNNTLEGAIHLFSESNAAKNVWVLSGDVDGSSTGGLYNHGEFELSGGFAIHLNHYGSDEDDAVTTVMDDNTIITVDSLLDFTTSMGEHIVSNSSSVAFSVADSAILRGRLQITSNFGGEFGENLILKNFARLDWIDRSGVTLGDKFFVHEQNAGGASGVRLINDFATVAGDTIGFYTNITLEDGDETIEVGDASYLYLKQGSIHQATIGDGGRLTVVPPNGFSTLTHDSVFVQAGGLFLCADGSDLSLNGGAAIIVEGGPVPFSQGGSFVDLNSGMGSSYGGAPPVKVSNNVGWTGWTQYTYWSSPVYNGSFWNISNFYSSYLYTDMKQGQPGWAWASGTFERGRGYAFQQAGGGVVNFVGQAHTGPIEGPNVGDDEIGTADENWTLIGNPYPSPISGYELVNHNTAINGAIYIWDQSSFNTTWGFETEDYTVINGSGTVGPDVASYPSDIFGYWLPQFQGVMVEGVDNTTPTAIEFENFMRDPDLISDYAFSYKSGDKRKMWLALQEFGVSQPMKTTCLVAFLPGASDRWDRLYDARSNAEGMGISSVVNDNGVPKRAVIQGLPSFSGDEVLTLQMDFLAAGEYELGFDSLFNFEGQEVWIIDSLKQSVHRLDQSNYIFLVENSGPYFLTLQFTEPGSAPVGLAEVSTEEAFPFDYVNETVLVKKDGFGLLTNVLGQVVFQGPVKRGEELKVQDFPAIFQFRDGKGKQYSKKLIQ